jgi:hypothetical protein
VKPNSVQSAILTAASVAFVLLSLFPPWQQAAEREVAYRLYVGLHFFLQPPTSVPVDCYFAGCATAPASYFHVLLYRDLLVEQLAAIIAVAFVLLWIFRSRQNGVRATLTSPKIRLQFSMLMASLVPLDGKYPLASELVDIPRRIIRRDEFWLVPIILLIGVYLTVVLIAYASISAALWFRGSRADGSVRVEHP